MTSQLAIMDRLTRNFTNHVMQIEHNSPWDECKKSGCWTITKDTKRLYLEKEFVRPARDDLKRFAELRANRVCITLIPREFAPCQYKVKCPCCSWFDFTTDWLSDATHSAHAHALLRHEKKVDNEA